MLHCPQHHESRMEPSGHLLGRDAVAWQGACGCWYKATRMLAAWSNNYDCWEELTPDELRQVYDDLHWATEAQVGFYRWMRVLYAGDPEGCSIVLEDSSLYGHE